MDIIICGSVKTVVIDFMVDFLD